MTGGYAPIPGCSLLSVELEMGQVEFAEEVPRCITVSLYGSAPGAWTPVWCWRRDGGEPVWFPWGALPMGSTPVSRRDDTRVTPWPKPRGTGVAWVGLAGNSEEPYWRGENKGCGGKWA